MARIAQVKIGSRHMVMPGQRMQITVVIMFTAPRMVPRPDDDQTHVHRSPPTPGELLISDSGA